MKRTYLVVYEKGRKNYGGFAPDVHGCISIGDTLEEMRANLREALELYMEVTAESGEEFPEATSNSITLPLEGDTDPRTTYVVEHLTIQLPKVKKTVTPRAATPIKTRKIKSSRSRELVAA